MPQHKSAAKRVRQDERRRLQNRQHKVRVRTMMKELQASTDREAAEAKLGKRYGAQPKYSHSVRRAGRRALKAEKWAHGGDADGTGVIVGADDGTAVVGALVGGTPSQMKP